MNKNEIYEYLKSKNIWHEITEHQAVYTMKDLEKINIPHKECDAKNLFLHDRNKENYYLITVKGSKKVDLKKFRKENNTRALSFASEEELKLILNLTKGSVTPLGILNDKEHKTKVYIDEELLMANNIIGVHPNDNTATIWLKTADLINILKENNTTVNIIKL